MGTFLRCDAVLVPASHFHDAGGARALQVQLSIDVVGPPDGQGHRARERFEAFLDRAPGFEFRLCTVRAPRPDPDILVRLGNPPQPVPGAVLAWLDSRTELWQWDPQDSGERALSAGQLLGASAGWAPDAARDSGLGVTLALPAGVAAEGKVLLPYLAGFEPGDIEWIDEDRETYAIYTIDALGESFRVRIFPVVEVLPGGNELVDSATGMVITAGGAAPDEEAHLVHEMLGALSLRGASQLSTAHALLGIEWPRLDAATKAEEAIRGYGRVVFGGISALTALFDPVLLSLVMPGSADEGPFIGAMITALDEALAGQAVPRALNEAEVDLTVRNLKQRIGAHLVLAGAGRPEREAFAKKLRTLLNLAPKPGEGQESPLWPDLLTTFGDWEPGSEWTATTRFEELTLAEVEQRLATDILGLLQWLESEDGSEAIACKLIESCLGVHAPGELSQADRDLALASLVARVKGNFNGADAARTAVGTLLVDAFVKTARGRDPFWSADDLRRVRDDPASNWFTGRLWKDAGAGSAFAPLLDALATMSPLHLDPADADPAGPLAGQLTDAWDDVRRQLLGNSDQLRFADSKIPQPLPVRINADADIAHGDIFARDYAGLGVLIRRETEIWAHANLATFALPEPSHIASDADISGRPIWVQPIDPAAVNGRRELFKNYDGFAFFEAEVGPNPAGTAAVQDAPYHGIDAPHRVTSTFWSSLLARSSMCSNSGLDRSLPEKPASRNTSTTDRPRSSQ